MSQHHLGVPFSSIFLFFFSYWPALRTQIFFSLAILFGNSRELTLPGANDANVSIVS